ncbi:hypothetical protein [Nitrosomonas communis]|uniref:hypothetical protein n=1 Tax=Nitrosomonas communis TaxID=44574 RepID=UPI0026F2B661|nr:hypothetical protein [Nitrosomonas communis]MCO6427685.1 hypothetical protein [Nitrosomonas communis]
MVAYPAEYRWPSCLVSAQGEADALVKPHPLYVALELDDAGRQRIFRSQVSTALGRRATSGTPGRPARL